MTQFKEDATGSSRMPVNPPGDPYHADVSDGDEVHVLDYVKVLHRRRWIVLTVFVVVVLTAVVYAFTQTPIYEARARLLIEIGNPNVVEFQQVLEEDAYYNSDYHATQYELLRSRSLVRQTLDELDLWNDPAFLGMTESTEFSATAAISGAVGTVTSLVAQGIRLVLPAPAPMTGDASEWEQDEESLAESGAIGVFLGGFAAGPVRSTRLVDISYRSAYPRLAARVINTHADIYINQNLEFQFLTSQDATDWLGEQLTDQRRAVEESEARCTLFISTAHTRANLEFQFLTSQDATDWLGEQLTDQRRAVEESEVALHRYRREHDAVSLEDRENIVVQRLAELSAAHTRAKTEVIARESTYRQLEAIASDPDAIDALPAVVSNRFIQEVRAEVASLHRQRAELSENLGARHPEMIKVQSAIVVAEAGLQIEIDKVAQSVRNEFLSAQAQERSLARELDLQKNEALAMNEMGIGYGVLARDVESNRQIYDSLLQRAKETGVSAELRSSNIRVVDRAEVPGAPISPRKQLILLIAMLTGGMGGIGLAFFFEYLDNRIKTPEDLKTHLGLPSLGLVPAVPAKSLKAGVIPLMNNGVPAKFSEAFRTVRTGVLFSTADRKRSLVITSTGPAEGKSVVAANLAIGLAQAQQRVLLIDGDMRRPTLHTALGLDQEPGLSNLLVGESKSQDVLRKTSVSGLWLLSAGKIPPNPAELLGSEKFKAFLDSLSEHFDWVLIDSPRV